MKTKTIIAEITKEDLVDFFSTAIYGSQLFYIKFKKSDYYGTDLESEDDCREDKWAKVLMSGKPVKVLDYYAEDVDEFYGDKPHKWDENECATSYTITLDDIKNGLQGALDSDEEYLNEYARAWVNGCYDLDLTGAEALLQFITFGEVVYG